MNNVVTLRPRPRPLRAGVPAFDPTNDKHLRAWESMFTYAEALAKRGDGAW